MGWWDRVWKTEAEDWVSGWLEARQIPTGAPSGNIEDQRSPLTWKDVQDWLSTRQDNPFGDPFSLLGGR